ncbi:beta-ketoacyl-[acyl-carrier-protein] synthase family protein [Planctomyces sp. SH-PL62]|uniref:beta-ketoacyl-[acyl-carrier-protein] synthase family protein n=1 Tax=Planctomyces sp. SH-PL62 TaxID=1636152 RepID=UPI00078E878A|nr:beta-ketoacyl-[acyl-carrier-protein] synthase family protein [Planctomyces sp. SH-PL62]AMV37983.1 3-oxoacyl-[acyl-carrier-protein] synthase 2 [Planctomyces sp. SH-PL62]
MHRVVITGIGVVAPNGVGAKAFSEAIAEGRSGVGYIESFDTTGLPIKIAGEVKNFDVSPYLGEHKKNAKLMSRAMRFAVGAAAMAVEDSGVERAKLDPTRFGVCMGTGITPVDVSELVAPMRAGLDGDGGFDMARFAQARSESIFPLWLLQHLPNMAAAHISILNHAMGPNNTIVTACAAGTQAVGDAFRLIARGDADVMLAGGCDSRLDPQLLVAYSAMKAVSSSVRPPIEVSRPFDADRDGFVLGEGAAVLFLESYRRARRRGARIYAEVTGYGSSFDAFGITRPEPEGKGAALSMTSALKEARIDADRVDYINAHGTSTRLNDLMETVAVKRVFGHRAPSIPMSSQKSMIGHLIGASGAVEAAATAMALEQGVVPPTINLAKPDPECDLDYVPNTAREIPVRVAMSNSFGFGGQNASLVLERV